MHVDGMNNTKEAERITFGGVANTIPRLRVHSIVILGGQ